MARLRLRLLDIEAEFDPKREGTTSRWRWLVVNFVISVAAGLLVAILV